MPGFSFGNNGVVVTASADAVLNSLRLTLIRIRTFPLQLSQRFPSTQWYWGKALHKRAHTQELLMTRLFSRFMNNESGATAIEYGLIAAGISVAIIATVVGLGSKLNTTFTSVSNALN